MSAIGRGWDRRVLPWLVEKACRSTAIRAARERWVPQAAGEVLEVGVGSGLNLAFYDPARVHAVVGIDPSPELLARAGRTVASANARRFLVTSPPLLHLPWPQKELIPRRSAKPAIFALENQVKPPFLPGA